MSLCSNSLRAWSRSRVSASKTLLPFLYQTTTIQQWKPIAQPVAPRNLSSRSNNGDDIPFEDESLPPSIDQHESARRTTITGSERAAFEKLYKTFNTQGHPKNDKDHIVELDQIADEYYEDDEENTNPSLDKVFDEVLKAEPRLRGSRNNHGRAKSEKRKSEDNAQPKDGDITRSRSSKAQSKRKDAKAEAARIKELRLAERERVDKLLHSAQTDRELWEILNRQVFEQVRKLDLDGTAPKQQPRTMNNTTKKSKSEPTTSDPRILFQNYPYYLITAISTLRTHFPSSPLALSILPTAKSLGRSSYALGATTTLYKHLIRTAWLQQSSYTLIDSLLVDMDNGAIEFDADVLSLLDLIIKEHEMARSGRLGREMQMVYGMEQFLEGIRKIRQWRSVVAERLGIAAPERRVQQKIVHAVNRNKREVDTESLEELQSEMAHVEKDSAGHRTQHTIPFASETSETQDNLREPLPAHLEVDEKTQIDLLIEELGLKEPSSQSIKEIAVEDEKQVLSKHRETPEQSKETEQHGKVLL